MTNLLSNYIAQCNPYPNSGDILPGPTKVNNNISIESEETTKSRTTVKIKCGGYLTHLKLCYKAVVIKLYGGEGNLVSLINGSESNTQEKSLYIWIVNF